MCTDSTCAGLKQWRHLVHLMGYSTTLLIISGLGLVVGCLITWQLTTQSWCADHAARGGCAAAGSTWAQLPMHKLLFSRLLALPCTLSALGLVPCRLDRSGAGNSVYPYRLLSYLFGFLLSIIATTVIMVQARFKISTSLPLHPDPPDSPINAPLPSLPALL